ALAVLLGRSPRQVVEAAVERSPDGGAAPAVWVPEGLPSELLLRRPDLRAAEHRLAAADARVDAARAGYFPSIALTGYLGSESARLSNLFSGPAGIWQFAATLLQPIFNAGRTSAEVEAAAARERQLIAAYRGAVANAFREVKDALVAQSRAREALEAETRRAEALQKATALARLRYDNGIASQLDVLDAERSLLQARLNRAEALRAHRVAVADLVRALGGGWSESPPEPMAAR
ncbi:MAG: TolC family protein, partial [Pseudomonadota bacterium]